MSQPITTTTTTVSVSMFHEAGHGFVFVAARKHDGSDLAFSMTAEQASALASQLRAAAFDLEVAEAAASYAATAALLGMH